MNASTTSTPLLSRAQAALDSLQLQARLLVRRVGGAGLLGILLLVAALLAFVIAPRLLKDANTLDDASSLKEQQLAHISSLPVVPTQKEQVRQYTGAFPDLAQNASDLKKVFDAAAKHKVELLKGEYQLNAEPNATFITYTAVFPVKDRYGTLKGFANDVLTAMPHVALEELRMERPTSTSAVLDARIRFTFIYKGV